MRFIFRDKSLKKLYDADVMKGKPKYPRHIIKRFFSVMGLIKHAPDERVFYQSRGLNFEALKGDRAGQYSLRLDKQWRC